MSFCALPEEVLEVVAQFTRPPDIYQLCLAMKTPRAFLTRLMNASLIESMKLSLRENNASFRDDIDLFNSFVNLALSLKPNSVAMSGSVVVQAALGVTWGGSDIDVYCTHDAAPVVRSWLIANVHQVLVGIDSGYSQGQHGAALSGMRTQRFNRDRDPIFQVEHWANAPNDGDSFPSEDGAVDRQWQFNLKEVYRPSPVIFRDGVVLDGPAETTDDALRLREVRSYNDVLSIPHEPRLCSRAGRDSRKDFINIDLIVMHPESRIVDAIDDFDIEICKCTWDGHKFRIPSPRNTFERRTELTSSPEVSDMLQYAAGIAKQSKKSFQAMLREMLDDDEGVLDDEGDEQAQTLPTEIQSFERELLLSEVKSIERELKNTPRTNGWSSSLELIVDTLGVFSPSLDDNLPLGVLSLVKQLRLKSMENVLSRHNVFPRRIVEEEDDGSRFVWADALYATHNSIVKRYNRLLKYKRRGIDVTPFPTVSDAMRTLPTTFAQLELDDEEAGDPENDDWWPRDEFEVQNPDLIVARIDRAQEERFAANEMKRRSAYFALLRQVKTGLNSG
jgi:hypothetical protein